MFLRKFLDSLTLKIIALAACLITLFVSVALPIYPDEVAYKIFLETYRFNGGLKQSLTPYCGIGFQQNIPMSIRISAEVWSLIYFLGDGWFSYRILPIISFSAVIFYCALVGKKTFSLFILCILFLGENSFGYFILRPEIFIIFLSILIYSIVRSGFYINSKIVCIFKMLIILFAFSLILYLHPKSLYLIPFLIISYVYALKEFSFSCFSAISFLVFSCLAFQMAFDSYMLHNVLFLECPNISYIEENMQRQSVNFLSGFGNIQNFFESLKKIFNIDLMVHTLEQIGFNKNSDIGYIPSGDFQFAGVFVSFVTPFLILYILLCIIMHVFRYGNENYLLTMVQVFLAIGLIVPFFFNLIRHWYDASLFTMAIAVIAIVMNVRLCGNAKFVQFFSMLTLLLTLSTTYIFLSYYFSKFSNGFEGPGISVFLDRSNVGMAVNDLLVKHNLKSENALIVDDLTYEYVAGRPIIVPATYLGIVREHQSEILMSLEKYEVSYGIVRETIFEDLASFLPGLLKLSESKVEGYRSNIVAFQVNYQ